MARAIVEATGGSDLDAFLPEQVDNQGVAPVILERAAHVDDVVRWLADRIREIELFVGQLPSIAIFVNGEDDVKPISESLNRELIEDNIQVMPCPNGQVIGQDNDVRVFDVQHIKGLEFEAAFFIGVDKLANLQPDLFDKYLYVGATRAATYLGITCNTGLPDRISSLRPMFVLDWDTN